MPTIAPAHDPDATGPRDWRELAALRAAHATMPHAAARAILDRDRVYALTAAQRTRPAIRAAREAAFKARPKADDKRTPEAFAAARADAFTALAKARAALRASRRPWPLMPCPVDAPRCPGHATVQTRAQLADLRRSLRATRPIRRNASLDRRRAADRAAERSAAA